MLFASNSFDWANISYQEQCDHREELDDARQTQVESRLTYIPIFWNCIQLFSVGTKCPLNLLLKELNDVLDLEQMTEDK